MGHSTAPAEESAQPEKNTGREGLRGLIGGEAHSAKRDSATQRTGNRGFRALGRKDSELFVIRGQTRNGNTRN